MILDKKRGLVSRVGLLVLHDRLDVLRIVEDGLPDYLTLTELRWVSKSEKAKVESRMAEVQRLEEPVRTAEEDSEVLRVARVRVDELMSERASFTAETDQAKKSKTHRKLVFASCKLLQQHTTESQAFWPALEL